MSGSRRKYVKKIDKLLARFKPIEQSCISTDAGDQFTRVTEYEALMIESWGLVSHVYGKYSVEAGRMIENMDKMSLHTLDIVKGLLFGIKSNIEDDLYGSYETKVIRDVIIDMTSHALELARAGYKDSAVVIGSAVFENAIKRLAQKHNIESEGRDLREVNNELIEKGVIDRTTHSNIASFVEIGKRAAHCRWEEIMPEPVETLLTFLPVLLERHDL